MGMTNCWSVIQERLSHVMTSETSCNICTKTLYKTNLADILNLLLYINILILWLLSRVRIPLSPPNTENRL